MRRGRMIWTLGIALSLLLGAGRATAYSEIDAPGEKTHLATVTLRVQIEAHDLCWSGCLMLTADPRIGLRSTLETPSASPPSRHAQREAAVAVSRILARHGLTVARSVAGAVLGAIENWMTALTRSTDTNLEGTSGC